MNDEEIKELEDELEVNKKKLVALETKYLELLSLPAATALDGVSVTNIEIEKIDLQIEKIKNRNMQIKRLINSNGSDVTTYTEYV